MTIVTRDALIQGNLFMAPGKMPACCKWPRLLTANVLTLLCWMAKNALLQRWRLCVTAPCC